MYKTKKVAVMILAILFCVVPSCIEPEAIKTDIYGIRNDLGHLEKIIEQKADSTIVAEHVERIDNRIEQTTQVAEELSLWRKNVEADTINYGGAGWVVAGTGIMALIFVGAGLLLIRAFMRRGNLLTLLTGAIQSVGKRSPKVVQAIKEQLKTETSNGYSCTSGTFKRYYCIGPFTEQDRKNLGHFAKKRGTFAEQK